MSPVTVEISVKAKHKPLSGAHVYLYTYDGKKIKDSFSDKQGRVSFELDNLLWLLFKALHSMLLRFKFLVSYYVWVIYNKSSIMCISERHVSFNPFYLLGRQNVISTEVLVELLPTPDHVNFTILDEEYNKVPYNKSEGAYELRAYEEQELELTIVIRNNESYTGSYTLKSELFRTTFYTALIIEPSFRLNVRALRISIPDIGFSTSNVSAISKGKPPNTRYWYIPLPENALDLVGKGTRRCEVVLRLWIPPLAHRGVGNLTLFIRLAANFDPSESYKRSEVYELHTVLKTVILDIEVLPKEG